MPTTNAATARTISGIVRVRNRRRWAARSSDGRAGRDPVAVTSPSTRRGTVGDAGDSWQRTAARANLSAVTWIDWLIVAFTVLLTLYGYLQGFIVGALSLAGFAVGAFLGTRLGPLLLPGGSHSPYAPLFGLVGALLAGGMLASGLEGLGVHARSALRLPGLRTVDGLAGAALTACVGLGIAWIVGAVALQSAGSRRTAPRHPAQSASCGISTGYCRRRGRSSTRWRDSIRCRRSADRRPTSPRRRAGCSPRRRSAPALGSVVRVLGSACGLGIEGSGWVAAPGIVVTNAHVVAGESDTTVQRARASAVAAGPGRRLRPPRRHRDPPGPGAVSSRAAAGRRGAAGGAAAAILGFPLDGAVRCRAGAARRHRRRSAPRTPTAAVRCGAQILALRGRVRPGNSGGPLDRAERAGARHRVRRGHRGGRPAGGFAVPESRWSRVPLARAPGPARCAGRHRRLRRLTTSRQPITSRGRQGRAVVCTPLALLGALVAPVRRPRPSVPPSPAPAPRGAEDDDVRGVAAPPRTAPARSRLRVAPRTRN